MAYSSLLSLTQTLEQILQSLLLDEEQLQLRSLHEKLSNLLLFLENSTPKNSETTSSLEVRIRDAAYEAENLVESHLASKLVAIYEAQNLVESHIASKSVAIYEAEDLVESHMKRKSVFSCFKGVKSRFQKIIAVLQRCAKCSVSTTMSQTFEETIEERLENVIEKLSSISEEVDKMKANNNKGDEALHPLESNATIDIEEVEEAVKVDPRISLGASSSEPTSSDKSSMVGFKDDMLQMKGKLIGSSTQLEIISIVGMGGIGKTTLTTNIYNDSSVNRHFDIRAWITVSQEYDVVALLAGLIRSMGEENIEIKGKDEAELKLKLYQRLKQRRYLIVMDDVWDDNVLEKFRNIFPNDNNGSRVIMTSRSSRATGSDNSSNHIHHLNFLSLDQSWNLLCQKAFGEERCPPELEDIGKRIAENCNGLALSLVAIGGVLLKSEKTLAQWKYVEKNMKSTETRYYDRVMEILSWSYNQLPYYLRACFLYMGVFREDFEIRVSYLIMLWVANGFIKPDSSKTLEEVAVEYLKDLIDRNQIIVREKSGGRIKTCVMHDLMRSMCIKKAQEETFIIRDNLPQSSIRFLQHDMCEIMPFQRLKVFNGCQISFKRFPIELVQLVNLRFIVLVREGIWKIPISLSKLHFLQTLIIFKKGMQEKDIIIPLEILKMPQLMHLWVEESVLPDCSSARLENLHTLCGVTNFRFTEETRTIFPNLKKLKVRYNSEESALGSCFENMVHLCELEHLKICTSSGYHYCVSQSHMDLAFPVKLRKLSLFGMTLSQRQVSTIGKLPNLEVLKLSWVKLSDGWKTEEGEFGELKFLYMRLLDELSWNFEGIHFPSLECLTCIGSFIKYLPFEIEELRNLKVINLYHCSSSVVDSANKIQEDREDWGNDAL